MICATRRALIRVLCLVSVMRTTNVEAIPRPNLLSSPLMPNSLADVFGQLIFDGRPGNSLVSDSRAVVQLLNDGHP